MVGELPDASRRETAIQIVLKGRAHHRFRMVCCGDAWSSGSAGQRGGWSGNEGRCSAASANRSKSALPAQTTCASLSEKIATYFVGVAIRVRGGCPWPGYDLAIAPNLSTREQPSMNGFLPATSCSVHTWRQRLCHFCALDSSCQSARVSAAVWRQEPARTVEKSPLRLPKRHPVLRRDAFCMDT